MTVHGDVVGDAHEVDLVAALRGLRARLPAPSWACLLARVFSIDVTTCPCGGRLEIVEVVLDPDEIARHLHGARAPPLGQLSLLPS